MHDVSNTDASPGKELLLQLFYGSSVDSGFELQEELFKGLEVNFEDLGFVLVTTEYRQDTGEGTTTI